MRSDSDERVPMKQILSFSSQSHDDVWTVNRRREDFEADSAHKDREPTQLATHTR